MSSTRHHDRIMKPLSRLLRSLPAPLLAAIILPATAQPFLPPDPAQSRLCRDAIAQVERALRLPDGFLAAISRVETGRPDGHGTLIPWPWSVNAAGTGHYYDTRQEAVDAVRGFQQQGIQSIDVGCLQVNLFHHPEAFPSLDMAFDPYSNARYAGQFLQKMKEQTGSWPHAAAAYHSQITSNGSAYLQQVLQQWAIPQDSQIPRPLSPPAPPHRITALSPGPTRAAMPYRPFVIQSASSDTSGTGINHAEAGPTSFLAAMRRHGPEQALPAGQAIPVASPAQADPASSHRQFRPFRGFFRPSMPPPPHQRMKSSQNGRSLAAYRAIPVHTVTTMPYAPAY
ncbi:lysozyme family protein [Bombella mellum]|uniref:Transglycosylase n=1 Tax=Bombella mellum TaxID=2039288 RepID=A0ABR5ZT60_9PROT|nr:lytic transglycosylase domain-containing protein [Bombella mellum]MBA5727450.1 transglycosylase [Bombella mellum]